LDTDLQEPIEGVVRALTQMSAARAVTVRTIAQAGGPMELIAASGASELQRAMLPFCSGGTKQGKYTDVAALRPDTAARS